MNGNNQEDKKGKISNLLLKHMLNKGFISCIVVNIKTEEFFKIESDQYNVEEIHEHFWSWVLSGIKRYSNQLTDVQIMETLSKDHVMAMVEETEGFSWIFDGSFEGNDARLEINASYLDEEHEYLVGTLKNITDKKLLEKFRYESDHDPVTGLYNRRAVFRRCRQLLEEYPDDKFCIIHLDMKHFRLYNTFFGEAAGDKMLCDIADMLRMIDADYDYWAYGRIEADVFCAMFPYQKEKYERHQKLAMNILQNYRTDFLLEAVSGMYFIEDRSMSMEAIFTRATMAAKCATSGNSFTTVIYNDDLEQQLIMEQQLLNDMNRGVAQEQFEMYLQPKYSLRTEKTIGAEAIVRWNHPERGIILPSDFIPLFERNGFISKLDRYMWEQVCITLHKWKEEGKPLLPISVNVSRISMFSKTTVEFLKELIQRYEIDPKYLELELTESAYIDGPEGMKAQMTALRDAGFKILLDDFGSGYSSLNTLRELPVDVLKLDMKFLELEDQDLRGGLVISSIVRMSKLLNLVVIAEGVETKRQADFLRNVGCEYVQGFLYAQPMKTEEFEHLLMQGEMVPPQEEDVELMFVERMLGEAGSDNQIIGNMVPVPMALMELQEDGYIFLKANDAFYSSFELEDNMTPVSEVFEEKLTMESRSALLCELKKSAEEAENRKLTLTWKDRQGCQKKYLCQISYKGHIGSMNYFIVVFTDVTELTL